MEEHRIEEIKASDLVDYLHKVNGGQKASQNASPTPTSPMFTFHTPAKPFPSGSFMFKKAVFYQDENENSHNVPLEDTLLGERGREKTPPLSHPPLSFFITSTTIFYCRTPVWLLGQAAGERGR